MLKKKLLKILIAFASESSVYLEEPMSSVEMTLLHLLTFVKNSFNLGSIHILLKVFASGTWLFQEFLHQGHHITLNTSRPSSKNKQRLIKTSLSKRYSKACLCSSPWMSIETIDSRGLKFPQECLLREGKVQNLVIAQERVCFARRNSTQLWGEAGKTRLTQVWDSDGHEHPWVAPLS